jgi:hypothetical protein
MPITFLITELAEEDAVLGYQWLKTYQPNINWKERTIRFPETHLNATTHVATRLAQEASKGVKKLSTEEIVPKEFHSFLDRFDKQKATRLPEHRPWDHQINLKPGWTPKKHKVYPLDKKKDELMVDFIKENLDKGFIRPSNSPYAAPFFFVDKKENDEYRPCQDYRELNENTIKDSYPLPRISTLIEGLRNMETFTKLDLRAGYNNL